MVSNQNFTSVFTGTPTVILYPGRREAKAANVLRVDATASGDKSLNLVPVFTGEQPAEKFRKALGIDGKNLSICGLDGFDVLLMLLEDVKHVGATHVQFNAMPGSADPAPVPIDDVMENLRRRSQ